MTDSVSHQEAGCLCLVRVLPGPNRRRTQSPYRYRLIFWDRRKDVAGCVMSWEVVGGRLAYQLDLERDEAGRLRWHCTCADAVFRAEEQGGLCKHVGGVLALLGEVPGQPPLDRAA